MVKVASNNFDDTQFKQTHINEFKVKEHVQSILQNNPIKKSSTLKPWLLKAVTVIDLTTLSGDDTSSNVLRLCIKAANPLPADLKEKLASEKEIGNIKCAAVCVYSSRVNDAFVSIRRMALSSTIQIASVATAFPSGLCALPSRLQEIHFAIQQGATEIDVVIDRSLVLTGKWENLYDEIKQMREACGRKHLKVILGVGELGSYVNIYKASYVAMLAGADFIKTSTGKETVNATLPVGLVMCRAIRKYFQLTGRRVGLKPAGGIKTARDAVNWLVMVHSELGPEWLTPKLFRIGASSLLDGIVEEIRKITEGDAVDDAVQNLEGLNVGQSEGY